MATTTKSKAKARAKATKGGTSKAATRKATRKATESTSEDRSAARIKRNAENTERMLEMREEGSSWSEIAAELGITPGKAQFLNMLNDVATGEVSKLTFKAGDDASLAKVIDTQRKRADQYSSWGWISARTGVSEPKLKSVHEEHNGWKPKTENIAIVRAAKNSGDTGSAKSKAKANGSTKKGSTATKAAKAKAKAKARAKTADPS